jgi:sulfite exporter TauE/SafE
MNPLFALVYAFLFGLLHGIMPDEHTWPITFSYAIGGASGKQGRKAALYFSAAFTVQRMFLSELANLALAPFLLSPGINGGVYVIVGLVMAIAGVIVLRKDRYLHLHLLGHHHDLSSYIEHSVGILGRDHQEPQKNISAPKPAWAVIHGFIAGFGLGGFSIFINTVAAPAMPSPWLGFLPGLLFGLGTMVVLILIGILIGSSLHWLHHLSEAEIKQIGAQTGGRTLFFGGLLFTAAGLAVLLGLGQYLPFDTGSILIVLFMIIIAVPAFVFSLREVKIASKETPSSGGEQPT